MSTALRTSAFPGLAPKEREALEALGVSDANAEHLLLNQYGQVPTAAYTDTTAKILGQLPAFAVVTRILIDVTTAFNDSGTDQLSIGKNATATTFKSALDVSSTGQTTTGFSNLGDIGSVPIQVTATYAGQNADSSAGAASIYVMYLLTTRRA